MSTKKAALPRAAGQRSRMIGIQVAVAAILIAFVAIIGYHISSKKQAIDAAANGPSVFHDGKLRFGNLNAKVTVNIIEDMACIGCKGFEQVSGDTINEMIAQGNVAVDYQPIGWMDRFSLNQYSSRAANAAVVVAEADLSKFLAWQKLMFEHQPPEGGMGLTDDQLIDIAKQAGYTSPAVAQDIKSNKYKTFVAAISKKGLEGISGTPHITVNGKHIFIPVNGQPLGAPGPAELKAAVAEAEAATK